VRSVIAVANLKGGVGKTTSAVYLAAAAVRAGYAPVTLVDCDPQASASEWLEAAPVPGVELVRAPTAHLAGRVIDRLDAGVVVVDTPPGAGDEKIVRTVVEQARSVAIATRVGGTDLGRVAVTVDLVPARTRRGLVVCAARRGTHQLVAALEAWARAGEQVWGVVPERVAIGEGPAGPLAVIGLVCYDGVLHHALGRDQRG